jgi:hypothetical protein
VDAKSRRFCGIQLALIVRNHHVGVHSQGCRDVQRVDAAQMLAGEDAGFRERRSRKVNDAQAIEQGGYRRLGQSLAVRGSRFAVRRNSVSRSVLESTESPSSTRSLR